MLNGKIDKNVPIPLYFQLKELIINEIKSGNYKKDELIPTEKEFMDMYQISRTTVRQAMTELVQEGWLYRIKSKGTFVTYPKTNHNFIQTLDSFNEQMERVGATHRTEVLALEIIEASELVAEGLNIKAGEPVIYLYRRRFANEEPVILQKAYLNYERCKALLKRDFTKDYLYKCLAEEEQTRITHVRRIVEVDEANLEDEKLLDMKKGKPVQAFITIGCNVFGEIIEYSLARYRGDKSRFEVVVDI
ncbi:MAG: GntR family transcriptional regulator [Eubacterium sp.]|nr:GntR family transcriptional regulator [Eubacterium sp.]